MPRIRIIFEKKGWITFLNHLDLPVLFSRAARRAGLSQEFTQGFSPHPHISLGPALAAGVEGVQELLTSGSMSGMIPVQKDGTASSPRAHRY